MANSVCTRTSAQSPTASTSTPWTPAHHAKVNKTKPVRLLELGTNPHGKTALLEFPEGWQRTIDLPTEADAWHPLFSELPTEDRRALQRHVAQPMVVRVNGNRTQSLGLSFTTATVGPRGCIQEFNHFDVPAQEYSAGLITGHQCAAELLVALQRGYGPHIDVRSIVHEAAAATYRRASGKPSQVGAGAAFMDIVVEALKFLATHSRHTEFTARKIVEAESTHAWCVEQDAKDKAEFVERMRQARAKKRAAKEVTA